MKTEKEVQEKISYLKDRQAEAERAKRMTHYSEYGMAIQALEWILEPILTREQGGK